MAPLDEAPQSAYRALVVGIALYFGLLAGGTLFGSAALVFAAQVLFGLLAIGVAALLVTRSAAESPLLWAVSAALVLGGVAQFVWLATGNRSYDLLASMLVLAGIAGYFLALLRAD